MKYLSIGALIPILFSIGLVFSARGAQEPATKRHAEEAKFEKIYKCYDDHKNDEISEKQLQRLCEEESNEKSNKK